MEVYREIMKPILLDALNEMFPNETWIVHHKDGNHKNNELFNLEVMRNEDHSKMHNYKSIEWLRNTRIKSNFPGATLQKQKNPEGKCWKCEIKWNNRAKYIALFEDPLSASIVYKLIASELNSLV